MNTKEDDLRQVTQWCAGMPLAECRPLTGPEQDALRREVGRHTVRVAASAVLLVGCALAMAAVAESRAHADSLLLAGLVLTGGFVVLAVYLGETAYHEWQLVRDLRDGRLRRFAGVLGEGGPPDPVRQMLLDNRVLQRTPGIEQSLSVLAASSRAWRANDRPLRRWVVVRTSGVAEPPPMAAMAAQWVEPVAHVEGTVVSSNRRDLSPAEVEELRRHIRSAWRPFLAGLLPWAWAAHLMFRALRSGDIPAEPVARGLTCGFLAMLGLFVLGGVVAVGRAADRAARLGRDAARGTVGVFRVESPADPPLADGVDEPSLEELTGARTVDYEVLMASRVIWTEGGRPAAWRKVAV